MDTILVVFLCLFIGLPLGFYIGIIALSMISIIIEAIWEIAKLLFQSIRI